MFVSCQLNVVMIDLLMVLISGCFEIQFDLFEFRYVLEGMVVYYVVF